MTKRRIYLDYGASTPVHPKVIQAMLPYWSDHFGNPSSAHSFGQEASRGLSQARRMIANLLNCDASEVIFTASGSESDNLAIRGVMAAARRNRKGNHLITSAIEHKAVLETVRQLERNQDFDVTILGVNQYGQIDPEELRDSIRSDTVLISIMAANNEIGSHQPIESIGRIARENGVLFHTDAIQAIAVSELDFSLNGVDLMSLAPHKFYGPKGVGLLIIRKGVAIDSVITGGSQEENRRAGTENVAFAVGASEALRLALQDKKKKMDHYRSMSRRLIDGILATFPDNCMLTGHPTERIPNHASFAFRSISGNDIVRHLDVAGIGASSGSACLVGDPKPSSVLEAIGFTEEWTRGGLRLTVGMPTTNDDVEFALEKVSQIIPRLEKLSVQFR